MGAPGGWGGPAEKKEGKNEMFTERSPSFLNSKTHHLKACMAFLDFSPLSLNKRLPFYGDASLQLDVLDVLFLYM